ncbi:sulfatase family protein [Stakelama saccharophila]|uniref:Sulfatase-like hydrolase/transferase n=1 Tax=Stakelama saccharophila TaxID=3075605 RepID=A0ABZ0B810_9SPHN|nr:sulfatase-like hydrolase/transferase [Stakelama sp. W311]WNO53572.1 sulfatase-like hydrolase/transferase [Stakelama sp. W311]
MNRRHFLGVTSILASTVSSPALGAGFQQLRSAQPRGRTGPASVSKPNILLIIADQHHAGVSKRHGYPLDVTPTMDRMAATGVDFSRAYCTIPACVPSRISMLTGRWPEATRVRMNFDSQDAYFAKDMYQVAREQGYRTGLAGKNHTYLRQGDIDFWRQYGHLDGYVGPDAPPEYAAFDKWLKTTQFNLVTEPAPFPVEAQHPHRIVSDAIDFIKESADQRFLLQVSFPEPHNPEQVPKPYWDMFPPSEVPERDAGPEALKRMGDRERWLHGLEGAYPDLEKQWRRYVSNYLGMLRLIDDQMKRLFDHLDESGLAENTVVVVTADHGDYMMEYGLGRKGVGLPDCLARIPMTWFGAGIRPNRELGESAHVSMADVMPTFCELMRAEIPSGVQGRSLAPLLHGEDYPKEEFRSVYATSGVGGLFYDAEDKVPYAISRSGTEGFDELNKVTQSGNTKMVRMGDWKLMYDMMGNGQLYHLPSDPAELNNRMDDPKAVDARNRLMAELLMWTIRSQDDLPTGPQRGKYDTKEPKAHNWFAPYRRAPIGTGYRP